jgi:hypothetical protein
MEELDKQGRTKPKYEPGAYVLVSKRISDSGRVFLFGREWGPGALKWMNKYKGWMYLAIDVPEKGFPVDGQGRPIIPTSTYYSIDENEIEGKA